MKKIIAFAGSNSKNSINKKLAAYVADKISNVESEILDLNDYELPLYGIDYEEAQGIPENAKLFLDKIKSSDGVIVSLAEHNGNFSVAFKNIYDWMSRVDGKLWNNKPMLLMATSPGERGGASVFDIAKNTFPRMGADLVAEFLLPSFISNFSENELSDSNLNDQLNLEIKNFEKAI
ncbi:MAG: NAD(P)H-dependent oxidoreductase [Flavobacteriaceae bacterium]|jgi:NAD(P)H-dependent FMN reductase|nr:NAD(P)H-dependent oxidoreductase [Flavobacteriaceae bacterium]